MEDSIRKSFPGSVAKHAGRGKLPSSLIDHTYYDYSALDIKEIEDFRGETCTGNNPKQKKSTFLSFPMKLHKIVSDPKYHDIIRWMPHGRAWNIYDKEKLKEICKEHFKHGSFESFNRSVNGWGFKRLQQAGPDHKTYYHELFLRGRFELCQFMERLIKPGRRVANLEREPNFYLIAEMHPLPLDSKKKEENKEKWNQVPQAKEEDEAITSPVQTKVPCLPAQVQVQVQLQPMATTVSRGSSGESQQFSMPSFHGSTIQHIGMSYHHPTPLTSSELALHLASQLPTYPATPFPLMYQRPNHSYLMPCDFSCRGDGIVLRCPHGCVHQYPFQDHDSHFHPSVHHPAVIRFGDRLSDINSSSSRVLLQDKYRHHNVDVPAVASVAELQFDDTEVKPSLDVLKTCHHDDTVKETSEYHDAENSENEEDPFVFESQGEDKLFGRERSPSIDFFIQEMFQTEVQDIADASI